MALQHTQLPVDFDFDFSNFDPTALDGLYSTDPRSSAFVSAMFADPSAFVQGGGVDPSLDPGLGKSTNGGTTPDNDDPHGAGKDSSDSESESDCEPEHPAPANSDRRLSSRAKRLNYQELAGGLNSDSGDSGDEFTPASDSNQKKGKDDEITQEEQDELDDLDLEGETLSDAEDRPVRARPPAATRRTKSNAPGLLLLLNNIFMELT